MSESIPVSRKTCPTFAEAARADAVKTDAKKPNDVYNTGDPEKERKKTMKNVKRILSLLLVLALTAAACMSLISCGKKEKGNNDEKTITVTVIDDKGESTKFTITTTSPSLRGALEQEDLIEGEESEYGLFVKIVNGIRADYDKDGAWWGFYKDGNMLPSGIDDTILHDGDEYEIRYEKA